MSRDTTSEVEDTLQRLSWREPVVLRRRDAACSYGVWRNVAVVIGHKPPSAVAVANYRHLVKGLLADQGSQVGLLTIVRRTSTPDPGAREALIDMFRELWPRLSGVAFVMEAQGFAAATQRAIGSALVRVMGGAGRVLIEPHVEDVVPWLAARLVAPGEERGFASALRVAANEFSKSERTAHDTR